MQARSTGASDIDHLHHVGHIVRDIRKGLDLYRRLGFQMTPAAFPSVSLQNDVAPKPIGAGNSHADLQGSFVELVAVLDNPDCLPADSTLVPLEVPAEKLPR